MPRVKRGFKAKHRRNKVFKAAKGFRGSHSKLFTHATVAVDRARQYAYRDRRTKKRDFRKLWIIRINAAARENGMSYSEFIHGLNSAGIDLDRKVLSDMAIHDPAGFSKIVEMVK